MIRLINGQGFELTLKNGSSITVFWGFGSKSENIDNEDVSIFSTVPEEVVSPNCEIRCYDPEGVNITEQLFKNTTDYVSLPSHMVTFAMLKLQNYDDNYGSTDED